MSIATDNPIRNGVDTATLFATLDAVKGNNEIAKFQFRATNRWVSGTHNQSTIHGFYGAMQEMQHADVHVFDADHPAVLVGGDNGPTPVEYVLARARRVPHRRHRQHRRGPRRQPDRRSSRPSRATSTCSASSASAAARSATATRASRSSFKLEGDDPDKLREVVEQSTARSAVYDVDHQRRARVRSRSRPADPPPEITTIDGDDAGGGTRRPPSLTVGPSMPKDAAMNTTHTIIIGGGQAGLALSRCLTDRGHDHVVLERGRVAERWHSERWNSLRLLTPNWMTRLPGYAYGGHDPDGFHDRRRGGRLLRAVRRVVRRARRRAHRRPARHPRRRAFRRRRPTTAHVSARTTSSSPPAGATVRRSRQWLVISRRASTRSRRAHYRTPDDLPHGGVLVVGASATGVQLAHELHASGRPVTLAVGSHSRMPRRYRGMDTFWWLDQIGRLRPHDRRRRRRRRCPRASRRCNSSAARTTRRSTCPTLQADGVRLAGRLEAIDGAARPARRRPRGHDRGGRPPDAPRAGAASTTPSSASASRPRCSTRSRSPRSLVRPTHRTDRSRAARASPAWCGPPATAAATTGSTSRSSTRAARSANAAASPRSPAPTCSASASSTTATRTSSTASAATPRSSPTTSALAPARRHRPQRSDPASSPTQQK